MLLRSPSSELLNVTLPPLYFPGMHYFVDSAMTMSSRVSVRHLVGIKGTLMDQLKFGSYFLECSCPPFCYASNTNMGYVLLSRFRWATSPSSFTTG